MTATFHVKPDLCRQRQAIEIAKLAGYSPTPTSDFFEFWSNLPIINSSTHALTHEPNVEESTIFFSSGGSTGVPKFTHLAFSEVIENSRVHGLGYQKCGIAREDVVATWGLPGLMSSEFTVYLALSATGCCILPIGSASDPETIADMIQRFSATVLLVMPSDLLPVVDYLEKNDKILAGIRLVVTGGEPLFAADEERFRHVLPDDVTFRSVFQTSDTGTIGYQCRFCPSGHYHVHEDIQLLEIEDSNEMGVGELVVTNLQRRLNPVVRMRTGDLAKAVDGSCPCGNNSGYIQLMGRTGRFVKVGGEKFDLSRLTDIRVHLNVRLDDFQVSLRRDEKGRDHFAILSSLIFAEKHLQLRVSELLQKSSLKLSIQMEHGAVGPVIFEPMQMSRMVVGSSGKVGIFRDDRPNSLGPDVPGPGQ